MIESAGMTRLQRSRTLQRPNATTETLVGARAMREFEPEFCEWASRRALPTTAKPTWLIPTFTSTGAKPWAIVARGNDGGMHGLLVLVDEQLDSGVTTSLAGTDQGNRGVLLTDTPESAEDLGAGLFETARGHLARPRMLLGPFDADDPRVHAFASAVPGAQLIAADPIPVIRQGPDDANGYLSGGMRRSLRKARNRLARDGLDIAVRYTTNAAEIQEWVPALEECHRTRDHVHGRLSDLDDFRARQLWLARLQQLSAAGELELATLHIDGRFAAYVLGALDHPNYRVVEGRFVTNWSQYSPGRLLEAAVLQRVLDDGRFHTLDWMTAVASEKLLATNHADPVLMVHVPASM